MNEQEAVSSLKRGDIRGLDTLVRAYQVQAVRTAYLVTGDRFLAEDVMQSAFLKAFEQIDHFDAHRPFGPWFLKIVLRDAIKEAKRKERNTSISPSINGQEGGADTLQAGNQSDPLYLLEHAEVADDVRTALRQLPVEQRGAIVQRYFLGMSEEAMASQQQRPKGTVKWRLHAARERLRHLLIDAKEHVS